MESEAVVPASGGRPRPAVLIALAAVLALALVWWVTSGNPAAPTSVPSNPRSPAAQTSARAGSEELTVRLDALKQPRPSAEGGTRNPFRFYTPPPPPPPPEVATPVPALPPVEDAPTGPAQPPPIPLKYIGLMEGVPGQGKVAAFSDCRTTMRGREGEVIAGQYRLVKIGVESVVVEYVDGRGRTTIRMSGQECVGK